jgi:hypothetical protein
MLAKVGGICKDSIERISLEIVLVVVEILGNRGG